VRTWIGDVQNILVELGAYFISKKKKRIGNILSSPDRNWFLDTRSALEQRR